jgi:hypothetical protein
MGELVNEHAEELGVGVLAMEGGFEVGEGNLTNGHGMKLPFDARGRRYRQTDL